MLNKLIKVYMIVIFVLVVILTGLLATHYYLGKQPYKKVKVADEMKVVA